MFLNLLLNAAQALDAEGRASVTVSADGASAHVIVHDTGPGIDADLIGRVFEPFVSTKADGTGLGLPIARQIVLAHGGTIRLESSPRLGTTVRVQLPLPA